MCPEVGRVKIKELIKTKKNHATSQDKKNCATSQDKNSHAASWDKKNNGSSQDKKIKQPFGLKINHATFRFKKKSHNLSGQKN